jgi:ubiquinone/menaquinone biosynthesis C-methylase UbiE
MFTDTRPEPTPTELGVGGILELASGYQRAQVLFAASALGVFGVLSGGPLPAPEVARALGSEPRGVTALLDACVELGLLRVAERGYQNTRTAQLFLVPGREMACDPVLRFWQRFSYGTWGRLEQAVRDGLPQSASGPRPDDLFDHLVHDASQLRLFFDGLAGLAYWPARKIAEVVDFGRRAHLLDVGGGSGAFSEIIAGRHPHLRVTLFDLEPVCVLARERFAASGLGGRAVAVAGDFHRDALPGGSDSILLANVLHDWAPEECLALLRKAHAALAPGGEVLVYEVLPGGGDAAAAALFALALVLDTKRGRVHRFEEIRACLLECGFEDVRRQPIVGATSLITGRRPAAEGQGRPS